jgi:hypothetical protein
MADAGMSAEDARRKQLDSINHREEQIAILANRINQLDANLAEMRSLPKEYSARELEYATKERERCERTQVREGVREECARKQTRARI